MPLLFIWKHTSLTILPSMRLHNITLSTPYHPHHKINNDKKNTKVINNTQSNTRTHTHLALIYPYTIYPNPQRAHIHKCSLTSTTLLTHSFLLIHYFNHTHLPLPSSFPPFPSSFPFTTSIQILYDWQRLYYHTFFPNNNSLSLLPHHHHPCPSITTHTQICPQQLFLHHLHTSKHHTLFLITTAMIEQANSITTKNHKRDIYTHTLTHTQNIVGHFHPPHPYNFLCNPLSLLLTQDLPIVKLFFTSLLFYDFKTTILQFKSMTTTTTTTTTRSNGNISHKKSRELFNYQY